MVFGRCALRPLLTAACSGIRPGCPGSSSCTVYRSAPRSRCCLPLAPRSLSHFLSSQGTLGARPAPCGGTWASPGHRLQRVGKGGFVSVYPCPCFVPGGPGAPHGHWPSGFVPRPPLCCPAAWAARGECTADWWLGSLLLALAVTPELRDAKLLLCDFWALDSSYDTQAFLLGDFE